MEKTNFVLSGQMWEQVIQVFTGAVTLPTINFIEQQIKYCIQKFSQISITCIISSCKLLDNVVFLMRRYVCEHFPVKISDCNC